MMTPDQQVEEIRRLEQRLKESAGQLARLDTLITRTHPGDTFIRGPKKQGMASTTFIDVGEPIAQETPRELLLLSRELSVSVHEVLRVLTRLVQTPAPREPDQRLLVWFTLGTSIFAGSAAVVLAVVVWITRGGPGG